MGFGLDSTPPLRALPANQARELERFMEFHEIHTLGQPAVLREGATGRPARRCFHHMASGIGRIFRSRPVCFVSGLRDRRWYCASSVRGLPVVRASGLLDALLSGSDAHDSHDHCAGLRAGDDVDGTEYRTQQKIHGITCCVEGRTLWHWKSGRHRTRDRASRRIPAGCALGARITQTETRDVRLGLWDVRARLPTPRNLLFIRDERKTARAMTTNDADPAHARTWLVNDLGSENARLQKLVPDRTVYLIDLGAKTLFELPPVPDSASR